MTLSVHADGHVTLTLPQWVSLRHAEEYVHKKSTWLKDALRGTPHIDPVLLAHRRRHYEQHREQARAHIHARLMELNQHYGYVYKRVTIRNNQTRWGSCSTSGNLSFDYRLMFLPSHLCDYVVVHELCHLKEMNHSARFWKLVAQLSPSYKAHRRELQAFARGHLDALIAAAAA